MIGSEALCFSCRHLQIDRPMREPMACAAFPAGIPREIYTSQVDHDIPYPGDNGLRFEPRENLPILTADCSTES